MSKSKPTVKDCIASIIECELAYTNGWAVTDEKYTQLCRIAADKIIKYVARRRLRRETECHTQKG